MDGVARDVVRRAEVFEDAGMAGGGQWLGRCGVRLEGCGGCIGWGGWLACWVEGYRGGVEIGGEDRDGAAVAVGAGLPIRDGEKRGPVGARQENIVGVVGETIEGVRGEAGDWGDGGSGTGGCEGWMGGAKRWVGSFNDGVDVRVQEEQKEVEWGI